MTNNFNFIFKCKEYGVDQKDTTTHEEHIILSNKEKGKDILLDRDYNVIGVQDKITESDILYYSKLMRLKLLPYPFDNYSLLDIMNLSKRFIICGNDMIINGIKVSSLDNDYDKVIRFILYLNRTIQDVFHKELDNKTSVSIFEYLKIHINSFNSTHKGNDIKDILEKLLTLLNMDNSEILDRLESEYDIPYDTLSNILEECNQTKLKLSSTN